MEAGSSFLAPLHPPTSKDVAQISRISLIRRDTVRCWGGRRRANNQRRRLPAPSQAEDAIHLRQMRASLYIGFDSPKSNRVYNF